MSDKFPYIAYFWNYIKRIVKCCTTNVSASDAAIDRRTIYMQIFFPIYTALWMTVIISKAFSLFDPYFSWNLSVANIHRQQHRATVDWAGICLQIPASHLLNEPNGCIFVHGQDVGVPDGSLPASLHAMDTIRRRIKSKRNGNTLEGSCECARRAPTDIQWIW